METAAQGRVDGRVVSFLSSRLLTSLSIVISVS